MTSDEKSTVSCESGSHYEGDFSYFPKDSYHLQTRLEEQEAFLMDKLKENYSIWCPECGKEITVTHFDWTALKCIHCGGEVEKDNWNREGTYDYYLRRMKEDNALKKQVGGQHYKDCSIQPVEYIFQNDLDYFEGNVVKYITRHRKKGEGKKDVEKAIHYAQLILELYYNE